MTHKPTMEDAKRTLLKLLDKIAEEQNYEKHSIEVREVSGGGSNLTSVLFVAALRAASRPDLRLFAKVAAMSEHVRGLSPMRCPFASELLYYTAWQPRFERLQRAHMVPEEHRPRLPRLHASCDEFLHETLVLDDLTSLGFRSYDRGRPADVEYAAAAVRLLADFHAQSLAYRRDDPAGFARDAAALEMDVSKMEAMLPLMKTKMLGSALAVAADEHRGKLERFFGEERPCRFALLIDQYRAEAGDMLVHGDFKPSNLMHRRRDGKLELALVDFQAVRLGSPVCDLTYFLFSGADAALRRRHRAELLDLYHARLRAALRRLGLDADAIYPEAKYREQLDKYRMLGLVMAVAVLPMVLVDESKMPSMAGDTYEMTDFVVEASALYRERFNGVLSNYVEWGLLE